MAWLGSHTFLSSPAGIHFTFHNPKGKELRRPVGSLEEKRTRGEEIHRSDGQWSAFGGGISQGRRAKENRGKQRRYGLCSEYLEMGSSEVGNAYVWGGLSVYRIHGEELLAGTRGDRVLGRCGWGHGGRGP